MIKTAFDSQECPYELSASIHCDLANKQLQQTGLAGLRFNDTKLD